MRPATIFTSVCLLPLTLFLSCASWALTDPSKIYVVGYSAGSRFHLKVMPRVQLMYEKAGLQVRFQPLPTKRVLVVANEGMIDGNMARIPSVTKSYKNLRRVDVPLIDLSGAAYVVGSRVRLATEAITPESRVGAVRGVLWSEQYLKDSKVRYANNIELLFKMLLLNRLDVVLATSANANTVIQQMGETAADIRQLEPELYSAHAYHFVHKNHVGIIPKLESALKGIRANIPND